MDRLDVVEFPSGWKISKALGVALDSEVKMTRLRLLFSGAVFLASFLLFLVEPMVAKQLLPIFGGSAAVWITCLVFFQTALLGAYLYAHWLAQRTESARSRAWIFHLALLLVAAVSALFFALHHSGQGGSLRHPFLAIFAALSVSIGFPFLALGATSPLLQVWLSRVESGNIPYRLFALSNLASLFALGLYPTLIEPYLTLQTQRVGWCTGFALFALVSLALASEARKRVRPAPEAGSAQGREEPPALLRHRLLWLLLPMGAAMQLSAITRHLTENIAAMPLLWILPLAVYLLSIIVAFEFPRLLPRWIVIRLLLVLLGGLAYMLSQPDGSLPLKISVCFFLLELFFACLFCHSEAYALRPRRVSEATVFYLLFAAGGALGSFLIGIASPLIFRFNYDVAITFFLTALLGLAALWNSGWGQRAIWGISSAVLLTLVILIHIAAQRGTPVAVRNFYGSLRVKQTIAYPAATMRTLNNGTIQHGTQIFSDELRKTPTTYYARDSGVGLAMRSCCDDRPRKIGVIGLGAGTMAAYGKPGDRMTFYEINPAVIPIAKNLFTYIRDSGAQIDIVEGDARTSLAQEPPQNFDVLVIDAFSGDAIPLHLLTTQALELYKKHLAPGGVLAFHISNQHVDLEPEVALLAKSAGMRAMRVSSPENVDRGEFSATWMLVSDSDAFFSAPEVFNAAKQPSENRKVRVWTDDYSSLLPILHW
jgi:spermidine synthase